MQRHENATRPVERALPITSPAFSKEAIETASELGIDLVDDKEL